MNKICFIARGLNDGGVQRMILNLLKEFENYQQDSFYVLTDREDFMDKFKKLKIVYIKNKNKIFWDYFQSLPVIKKIKPDCIIYPKNIIPLTHLLLPAKKINVIHDLGYFEKNLNAYKTLDTIYMKTFMKLSCQIANKTIAVSEFTKKDIINRLNINSKKITTILEAVEEEFKQIKDKNMLQKVIKKYDLKLPFIFYCGSLSPRKNLIRSLKAFNKIKDKIPHNFYLTGNTKWAEDKTLEFINKNENLSKRVKILGYLPNQELVVLYNLADFLLFPSLYEGFGLPILEAQACGCPVLTSNATSCPEVADDSAHLVDPYSIDDIKNGILKISKDKNYKKELIKKGFENVKRFSWEKTAQGFLKEINDLLIKETN